jgi:hypothetical protein
MTIHRSVAPVVACLALVAAACGGSSGDPAASTQAPPPATSATPKTPAPPPPTTTAAPTLATTLVPVPTTTTASPLPDGRELLAAMNAAMAEMPTFLGSGRGFVKEAPDTLDADAYVEQFFFGGGIAGGDFWGITLAAFNTPGLTQSFVSGSRTVAGVDYSQDLSGMWEVDDDGAPDPIEDAVDGRLEMADVTVTKSPFGYVLTGTYPTDPDVVEVVVEINANTSRLHSLSFHSRLARSEFEGLIPADGGDLFLTQRADVTAYDVDIANIAAPPVGRQTVIIPGLDSPFITSIPGNWEQLPASDIDAIDVTDAYIGPEQIGLLVVVEDLAGTGITTLDEYVNFLVQVALADSVTIDVSDPTSTLQGERAWIGTGTANLDGSKFRRLVYMTPDGIGVNISFVQGIDEATNELTPNWDTSQDLIAFMLNSFLVFLGDAGA